METPWVLSRFLASFEAIASVFGLLVRHGGELNCARNNEIAISLTHSAALLNKTGSDTDTIEMIFGKRRVVIVGHISRFH